MEEKDNAISRQTVLGLMQMKMGSKELYKAVYELPPVTPQPKTGRWILVDEESNTWKCTNCIEEGKDDWWQLNDGTPQDNKMDYCPHCGAKMTESEDGIF